MPNRLWGTYFGGTGADQIQAMINDASGNVLFSGTTLSYGSSYQAMLIKFDANGKLLWEVIIGGTMPEYGSSVTLDPNGNVILAGMSSSLTVDGSTLATQGAHKTTCGFDGDAYIAKFNGNGIRQWATYYGGNLSDEATDVVTDNQGNVYFLGNTNSTVNIATNNGNKKNFLGGSSDCFLTKLSATGVLQWSTYVGGSGADNGTGITIDNSNNIIITGNTQSSNGISEEGSHQAVFGGQIDGFVTKFSSTGDKVWSTYFGGDQKDEPMDIRTDSKNNIYVVGGTNSTNNIGSNNAFLQSFSGGQDGFLLKLNNAGKRVWSTYYGHTGRDELANVAIDKSDNIYIGGFTNSKNNIATSGAHKTVCLDADAMIALFDENGYRYWGSYYGGTSTDVGSAVSVDNQGNVFLAGGTRSSDGIATPGAHLSRFYETTYDDGFLVKFTKADLNAISAPAIGSYLCPGQNVTINFSTKGTYSSNNVFIAQLSDDKGSFTQNTIIGTSVGNSSGVIECFIPENIKIGSGYRMRLVSSSPMIVGSDNGNNLTVGQLPKPVIIGNKVNCVGATSVLYETTVSGNSTYVWNILSGNATIESTNLQKAYVSFPNSGSVTLDVREINSQGCIKDTQLIISVIENPAPVIVSTNNVYTICSNVPIQLDAGIQANVYQWKLDNKDIQSSNKKVITATTPGQYSVIVFIGDCLGFSQNRIIGSGITPNPVINGLKSVQSNQKKVLYHVRNTNASNIDWGIIGNATLQILGRGDSIQVDFQSGGTVKLIATETTVSGCKKDTSINIQVGISNIEVSEYEGINSSLSIVPNPAIVGMHIEAIINGDYGGVIGYTISDILGKIVLQQQDVSIVGNRLSIDTRSLPKGTYSMNVILTNENIGTTFILN